MPEPFAPSTAPTAPPAAVHPENTREVPLPEALSRSTVTLQEVTQPNVGQNGLSSGQANDLAPQLAEASRHAAAANAHQGAKHASLLAQHSKYKEETTLVQREMQAKFEELLRSNAGLAAEKEQAITQHQTTTEAMRAQMNEAVSSATKVANEAQRAAGSQVAQLQSVIAWLRPAALQAGLNLGPPPDLQFAFGQQGGASSHSFLRIRRSAFSAAASNCSAAAWTSPQHSSWSMLARGS